MSAQSSLSKIILKEYIVTIRQSNKIIKKRISAANPDIARMGAEVYGRVVSVAQAPKNLDYYIDKIYRPKLGVNERFQFFQTLANFLKGYTLNESLRLMSENFNGAIKRVCNDLRALPSRDFTEQLEAVGERDFPPIIIEVIRANSRVSSLSETLLEAVRFERNLIEAQRQDTMKLVSSTLYLLGMMLGCILLVWSYDWLNDQRYFDIIPDEGQTREAYHLLMHWSNIFEIASWSGIAFYLIAICLFAGMKSAIPVATDKFISMIPVIRDVVLLQNSFLVTYQIGVLVEKGIELKTAFEQVALGCEPGALRQDLHRVLNMMKQGDPGWQRGFYSFSDLDRALLMSAGNSDEAAAVFQAQANQFTLTHKSAMKVMMMIQMVITGVFGIFLILALTIVMFLPAAGGLEMM
jgi:type II secretory pathway component PulF